MMLRPPLTVRVLPEEIDSKPPAPSVAAPLVVRSRSTVKPFALNAIGAPRIVLPGPVMLPPIWENALLTVKVPAPVKVPPLCA